MPGTTCLQSSGPVGGGVRMQCDMCYDGPQMRYGGITEAGGMGTGGGSVSMELSCPSPTRVPTLFAPGAFRTWQSRGDSKSWVNLGPTSSLAVSSPPQPPQGVGTTCVWQTTPGCSASLPCSFLDRGNLVLGSPADLGFNPGSTTYQPSKALSKFLNPSLSFPVPKMGTTQMEDSLPWTCSLS